jgi:glycosyltransferase involved in cell wall biosynthesis
MNTSLPISAVIITKNEAHNLARCLESLVEVVDEMVVVDSGSTDATVEIALSFPKTRVVQREWEGYARTKNAGNALAVHDWILSLDADEALTPMLRSSIAGLRLTDDAVCYRFARLTNYCGAWIRHCHWYPDAAVRLFHRGKARWEGDSVHEKLRFEEGMRVVTLPGDCLHYSIPSIAFHLDKVNRYSSLWAEEAYKKGRRTGLIPLLFKPFLAFFNTYVIHAGFRDGYYGFVVSVVSGMSRFMRLSKLLQWQREHRTDC